MKKNFKWITVVLTTLLLGLTACNKDNGQAPDPQSAKGDTFVGLQIQFPTSASLKADPDEDYNPVDGFYQGRDKIESITVYLVSETNVFETEFTEANFNAIDGEGILKPTLAVEAQARDKVKAYVLINATDELKVSLKGSTPGEFNTNWAKAQTVQSIDNVSKTKGNKDVILMTNSEEPVAIDVHADVTEEMAKSGKDNQIKVNVMRVTARGIVTIAPKAKAAPIQAKATFNTYNSDGTLQKTETVIQNVTVKDVKYVILGSAAQYFPIQNSDYKVPSDVYDFIPTKTWGEKAKDKFFMEDDLNSYVTVQEAKINSSEEIINALNRERKSQFSLPVTHASTTGLSNNYRKGNTPMFAIEASFVSDKIDGKDNSSTEPQTLYYGLSDGLFYSTMEKAQMQNPSFDGAVIEGDARQEVLTYTNGKMYYYLWLNPNKPYANTEKIKESPVYRNQVYNAHITGFKELGKTSRKDLNPDEELETDKTYLSAQIKVLPQTIHSYEVNLGNRY